MDFSLDNQSPDKVSVDCVIVGVFENNELSPSASALDKISQGFITNLVKQGDIEGKSGQTLLLHQLSEVVAKRVLLVGCGKKDKLTASQFRKICNTSLKFVNSSASQSVFICLTELEVPGMGTHRKIRQVVESAHYTDYRFEETKSEKTPVKHPLETVFISADTESVSNREAIKEANAIGLGVNLARELGNLPGNICTPTYLAKQAVQIADDYKNIKATILEQTELEKLGMGSFLSVAKGSREAPKLIILEYSGADKNNKPHVLVGKGITFDSGGISLKPGQAMDEMKFDMCGAASVIGTMKTIAELQPDLNVVAIVPSCENLPDGLANKPGDVVTSMSGQTIEVLNTDAEGRLILCDALTYSEKYEPASVIDVATLTGACVIALGKHPAGLLSNSDELVEDIKAAASTSQDRVWQLPLWEEYDEQLKSNFADMANIGGRDAGTITAACFLARFTKKLKWAHLDIAGVAWESGATKGATGRPVPLLSQYLLDRCNKG
ncbi:MAG: leucyl aminopeptidase [Gammaproteobacteria bacterium]|nr:leucyl aminopeptidase [Gammaproteobacteria bacterium]